MKITNRRIAALESKLGMKRPGALDPLLIVDIMQDGRYHCAVGRQAGEIITAAELGAIRGDYRRVLVIALETHQDSPGQMEIEQAI